MNAASDLETMEMAKSHHPKMALQDTKESIDISSSTQRSQNEEYEYPTEEELATLRRVSGKILWTAYSVAFVELCERFSYYGTIAVFVNFIQQPLPPGSSTGAGKEGQSGALDMGQRAAFGLTTFNAFWAYVMPLLGAYMADQYWGRFKTIQVSIGIALVGHVILIISALPPVITNPNGAIAAFAIGIVIMGIGVGGFKSNISPLIAEQSSGTETVMRIKTTPKGERVIMDPAVTTSRVYLYFYLMINIGALTGSIGMVYAEKYVGFWLSYTLPTLMLCLCPFVILGCRKRFVLQPPTGSTLSKAMKLWKLAMGKRWSWNPITFRRNVKRERFWEDVMPSKLGYNKPAWMTFDDAWVDEVRRGLIACKVFLWYPLYWLAYGQMTNNLTSQAATMKLGGVPNDVVSNFNPLFIVILIPIMDQFIYPGLRKIGFNFTPIKRITCGFFLASFAMISATVTQHYIYKMGPCGNQANSCEDEEGNPLTVKISVWVQLLPYGLIGFSEIMASVTSLEYAFTKAPTNMRSTVQAIALFMNAVSSALSQALVALAEDPLLVWNYGVVAVVAAIGGVLFWLDNRKIDGKEDKMNLLPHAQFKAQEKVVDEESGADMDEMKL
ncbi:probable MFS peptide transporter, putaitve [Phialocephala subalpina]|uniref:Probable MFS peptide transporter, putaitve n=1 Tax=Phialocephala subalpina TaxID=576137 RepID=A0A1L7XKL8_9HELO|nr:probable MFS peptide transporter, putaitve [Phialocephala subalpina]